MTKIDSVMNHLIEHRCITSWDAIRLYRATRLSAIIYELKHHRGMNISTKLMQGKDEEGRTYPYALYVLED